MSAGPGCLTVFGRPSLSKKNSIARPRRVVAFVSPVQVSPQKGLGASTLTLNVGKILLSRRRDHVEKILVCWNWVQVRSRQGDAHRHSAFICMSQFLHHRDTSVTVETGPLPCFQAALVKGGSRPHECPDLVIHPCSVGDTSCEPCYHEVSLCRHIPALFVVFGPVLHCVCCSLHTACARLSSEFLVVVS